jgi:uncharacterized protein
MGLCRFVSGVLLLLLTLSGHPAVAQPGITEGVTAYMGGDYAKATRILRPIAEQGDASAQYLLAVIYIDGLDGTSNAAEGMQMARRSAEQGHRVGQYILGRGYHEGRGIVKDYVLAHMWFTLAASQAQTDDGEAGKLPAMLRDRIASKMTPAEIAEAQRLARDWEPKPEEPQ